MSVANEIVVDARGRTTLAKARSGSYDRYEAEELPDGTLILRPLVSISPVELAALRNPEVRAALDESTGADRSRVVPRRSRSVSP